jgi:metallo-beta-lactamase class B
MKPRTVSKRVFTLVLALGLGASAAQTQSPIGTIDEHIGRARGVAGLDFLELIGVTCDLVRPPAPAARPAATPPAAAPASGPPPRATWHAEPARVFDNLYFVGQTEYSAWAVTTSDGIILMDAIFDYSVEDEVVGGLTKLGLDPNQIKYVVISHAHGDHVGGAGFLQKRGARIVMSAADWDLMDAANVAYAKPSRDVVATDGQKLTLGDTTVTLHVTPGHTLGTLSSLIPVKDGGRQHVAAYWGGTAFNWVRTPANYITPDRPARFWFTQYATSAQRFRDLAARASADVLLSNHTNFDDSKAKLAALRTTLRTRAAGSPHPYVVGADAVRRYLTVADECALAGLASTGAASL